MPEAVVNEQRVVQSPQALAVSDDRRWALGQDRPIYHCPKCNELAMQFFAQIPGEPERSDVFRCYACGSTWDL